MKKAIAIILLSMVVIPLTGCDCDKEESAAEETMEQVDGAKQKPKDHPAH